MDEALLRQFEDMGPEAVRRWLDSGQMRPAFQTDAREWLGRKEEQHRNAAAGTKKINIAQSADADWGPARAAKRANQIAIAALALAALAIVVSIVALIVKTG